jgi:hypothetical protein
VHRSVGLSEWTVYITFYLVDVFLEIFHKFETLRKVSNVHYVARYVFVDNFSVLDINRYACVADGKSIARWVETHNVLALDVLDSSLVSYVVMTEENEVESRYFLSYAQ